MSSNRSRSADIVLMIVIGVGAAAMMSASEYYGGLSGRAVTILLLAAAFFISWREFAHFSPIAKALGYFGVCLLLLLGGMIVADLINGSIGLEFRQSGGVIGESRPARVL